MATSTPPQDAGQVGAITTASAPRAIEFAVITATCPPVLVKSFGLDEAGQITSNSVGSVIAGKIERCRETNLAGVVSRLDALLPSQAVTWGVPGLQATEITLKALDDGTVLEASKVARTRERFSYLAGPGIMMFDFDETAPWAAPCTDAAEARDRLLKILPELGDAPMAVRRSSSGCVLRPDGSVYKPGRFRALVVVADASQITVAGERIAELMWARGGAWYVVGNAGQRLTRGLVDIAVWMPERLDFAGPPIVADGLALSPNMATLFNEEAEPFDLTRIEVPTAGERAAAKRARGREAARVAAAAERRRNEWVAARAPEMAQRQGIDVSEAERTLRHACTSGNTLVGKFELYPQEGGVLTVSEILADRKACHLRRFADPYEPDADRRVAVLRVEGRRVTLYSHRHGGVLFILRGARQSVEIRKGDTHEMVDEVLEGLREAGELFDMGDALVYVDVLRARAHAVSSDWLFDHVSSRVSFYKVAQDKQGNFFQAAQEVPDRIIATLLARKEARALLPLTAVVTAPTLRPDGTILEAPGYDTASGIYFVGGDEAPMPLPDAPTVRDAMGALRVLWAPFASFPFEDALSSSVMVAALMTACWRAALPAAPAFGFDAPVAGSGKTLLAKCVGALATGKEIKVSPPLSSEDDEVRKTLFAALRDGDTVFLSDNVLGSFGTPSLDAYLTSSSFSDRVLGESRRETMVSRSLFLLTGNNISLRGDTARRVLLARVSPEEELPFLREFDFDPLAHVLANRAALVRAALIIYKAWKAAGAVRLGAGRTASFEAWDDTVRQPILWLADAISRLEETELDAIYGLPLLTDPAESMRAAAVIDPELDELREVLRLWNAVYGSERKSARDVCSDLAPLVNGTGKGLGVGPSAPALELAKVLQEILPPVKGVGGLSTRGLGYWLRRRRDRRVDGLCFEGTERPSAHDNVVRYRVVGDRPAAPKRER